ncbi:hypothetical protein CPAR01_10196 [Colletotrichum paranaense]|uniref:Secreted protein n=2 Tax=Colletotrichum acutatum species complex TaxID=2707335 RepID=A0AAI9XDS6_9PEZI|nr:uncharacterized protein CPAR01_10196 [Colletotrichum paranaense]KAK1445896.1 hypothetical protein CMEL01_10139 [Colletotrichum melonis]KAK1533488.1 hypothetical protein CPAR01_10196 [Colletotrichum paranaense]
MWPTPKCVLTLFVSPSLIALVSPLKDEIKLRVPSEGNSFYMTFRSPMRFLCAAYMTMRTPAFSLIQLSVAKIKVQKITAKGWVKWLNKGLQFRDVIWCAGKGYWGKISPGMVVQGCLYTREGAPCLSMLCCGKSWDWLFSLSSV